MTTSANKTLGFDVSPDATSGLTLGVLDGAVNVGGTFKKFVAQAIVLPESATSYVEVTNNGIISSNVTGFTSGANFLYVVTTSSTAITAIEDWRANPAVGSPNVHLSASPSAGIGYQTGAGGAVTQATNKSTGVTSDTITTAITLNGASLAAATIVSFTFTNASIAATDTVLCTHESAGTSAAYTINAFPSAGSAVISVRNNTAGALAEAIVLRVTVIKSVSA